MNTLCLQDPGRQAPRGARAVEDRDEDRRDRTRSQTTSYGRALRTDGGDLR